MPIFANVIEEAFSPLISLFQAIMVFIHNDVVGGSWGLAIIGLTIVTRAVLVPVTYKQLRSMQEMQRYAPQQLKALQEKYKEDKQRQQQEIMKFYKENKINPLSSCLPFLLQIPVFISLFYMLRTDLKKHICGPQLVSYYNSHANLATKFKAGAHIANVAHLPGKFVEQTACHTVALHSAKFLFLPDITEKATGVALVLLIVLYAGSQIASTLLATASADPNTRRMMLLVPLVVIGFLFRYPAGLLVYWITTNLWTIVQQYFIRRRIGPPPAVTLGKGSSGGSDGSANGKADNPKGPKGEPALAGAGPSGAPPPPPRRKKKRSGRRR